MLIPIDRPLIDARNIREAATQMLAGAGFTIQHNNRASVHIGQSGPAAISDGTTAIVDGSAVGHKLILLVGTISSSIIVRDGANTVLEGDWNVRSTGSFLKVEWDGSNWVERGRHSAGNINSGQNSGSLGGSNNTSSGGSSASVGGANNTSSNDSSASVGGSGNTSSGGSSASVGGSGNTNSGYASASVGGQRSVADQKFQFAQGGSKFTSNGDSQYSRFALREAVTHSDANWNTIGIDNSGVGPIIPADSIWTFTTWISGGTPDMGKSFSFIVHGSIKRIGNTTTLKSMNVAFSDVADDVSFECQAVANDGSDTLSIQVRDTEGNSDSIRWTATVQLTQLIYT